MPKFRIVRITDQTVLGDYEADSPEHALTMMVWASTYPSFTELCNSMHLSSQDFRVFKLDDVRQPGFTCPLCGSHHFGTSLHPPGTNTGHCNENQYSGNGCKFIWNRDAEDEEQACMFEPTEAEWNASYDAKRQSGEVY